MKPSAERRKHLLEQVAAKDAERRKAAKQREKLKDAERRKKLVDADKRRVAEQVKKAAERSRGCCKFKLELPSVFVPCVDCPERGLTNRPE